MRHCKYILLLLALLLAIGPTAEAQIWRALVKKGAKRSSEKIIAKQAGKEIAEKTTRELAEEMAQKSVSKWTGKTVSERVLKTTPRVSFEMITEKGTKEILSENLPRLSKEVVEASTKKGLRFYSIDAAKTIASSFDHNYIKAARQESLNKSEQAIRKRMKDSRRRIIQFENEAERQAVKNGIKGVENSLGETAAKIWTELAGEANEEATQQLLKDIGQSPTLRKLLRRNPDLLRAYYRIIGTPYRTDVRILRYLNYGAGKYGRAFPKFAKYWGLGDDIVMRTERGVTSIYSGSGEFLGTISGNAKTGYEIVASESNRTLLNLFPLGNATYKCEGCLWKTDRFGRVIYAKTSRVGEVAKSASRDNRIQKDAVQLKNGYTVNGDMSHNLNQFPDDEGGHIIALKHGGTNDLINFVPQSKRINRNEGAITAAERAWYRSEYTATKAMEKGQLVEREVYLSYSNNTTMRPSSFRLTQKIDGRIDVLPEDKFSPAIAIDDLLIDNPS